MTYNNLTKKFITLTVIGVIFVATLAPAAVFTVTSLNDSGPGSLRQAILNANSSPGAGTINFNIPGSGVQTFALTNALPDITNAVAINGYSQPGSSANTLAGGDNAVILIRLDGLRITNSFTIGLTFSGAAASGSAVRGVCLVRFSHGIQITDAANVTVGGNWVGMDLDGVPRGMKSIGIYINSFSTPANNIVVGGATPADRNVVSGNHYGIYFSGATTGNCFVQGNFIGTDPSGTLPRGNMFTGVDIVDATNITVGGGSSGVANVICGANVLGGTGVTVQGGVGASIVGNFIGTGLSGLSDLGNMSDGVFVLNSRGNRITGNEIVNNGGSGINLQGASGTVIEHNSIGTDASGVWPLGNLAAGITINGSTNRVGGLGAAQANVIQFNTGAGVEVTAAGAVQNEISGNGIYDNGGLGIDLYPIGITLNDGLDGDSGANTLQNYPLLTKASTSFGSLTVQGALNSKARATYRLEFFVTPAWDAASVPEGKTFVGSTSVLTDGNGNAVFTAIFVATPATNLLVTATAIDANGNTSEFSPGIGLSVNGTIGPALAVVKGAAGSGAGSSSTTTVSWPSAASSFGLEQTGSLVPPVAWQAITSGIVDFGDSKTFTITNNGTTNQYFRLKMP